jgi:hypothetical protein
LKAPDVILAGTTLSNGPTKVDQQISPRSINFISYPKQSGATSWLEKNCVSALTARGNIQETKCKQEFESLVAITSDYNHIYVHIQQFKQNQIHVPMKRMYTRIFQRPDARVVQQISQIDANPIHNESFHTIILVVNKRDTQEDNKSNKKQI